MYSPTPPQEIEHFLLSAKGWELLTDMLRERGNTLSGQHAVALLKLMEVMAGYATGAQEGRNAFPLPTGMGKTTGILAFTAAAWRLGYRIPMAIAASQVQALVDLKRELIALGVPEDAIGLAHRDPKAAEPSTGCAAADGRLIQLVTHARVRLGDDYLGLFAEYCGKPRALMVYDESLFRADAFAFLAKTLGGAVAALAHEASDRADLRAATTFLREAVGHVDAALTQARSAGMQGTSLELPEVPADVLGLWRTSVASVGLPRAYVEVLQQFLDVCQLPLQALPLAQGGGAIAVRQAVSDQLQRVLVLDASAPIRDLLNLDSSIKLFADIPADVKSFEEVEVRQVVAAGGRSSIEQSFRERVRETSTVSKEVLAMVREELASDPARCILFFTFKKSSRSDLDIKAALREDLRTAGLDPDETVTIAGTERPRFPVLHWGQHEGLNGYEYCQTVVLAGVLHRSHLDIAAHIKGQQMNLSAPTPHEMVCKVIKSEVAHCVYQAASRGSCRRVTYGKANVMRLWLIHSDPSLRDALTTVMPRAVWTFREPAFLKKASGQQGSAMRGRILEALLAVPAEVLKVSTRRLKEQMTVEKTEAAKKAFTRALQGLDLNAHGWRLEGQSLVRGAVAYGF
jgi:hypothetical protein